jgi:hypothetical protein
MNDLRSFALQNAAHDINSGIMAIEQTGGSNNADLWIW